MFWPQSSYTIGLLSVRYKQLLVFIHISVHEHEKHHIRGKELSGLKQVLMTRSTIRLSLFLPLSLLSYGLPLSLHLLSFPSICVCLSFSSLYILPVTTNVYMLSYVQWTDYTSTNALCTCTPRTHRKCSGVYKEKILKWCILLRSSQQFHVGLAVKTRKYHIIEDMSVQAPHAFSWKITWIFWPIIHINEKFK